MTGKLPAPAVAAHCQRILEQYGDTTLYAVAGGTRAVAIDQGYLPLRVNFTHEDKEAKGLRSLKEDRTAPIPAVHFTALEQAASEPLLLLMGEHGSGKTTFALHLALHLAGQQVGSMRYNVDRLRIAVPRNEHGHVAAEHWSGDVPVPVYLPVDAPATLHELLDRSWPEARSIIGEGLSGGMLLIVDEADRLGDAGQAFLDEAVAFVAAHPGMRVLITGESGTCRNWIIPPAFRKYSLMPLLNAQRKSPTGMGNPGLHALAMQLPGDASDNANQPDRLIERWLDQASGGDAGAATAIVAAAFRALSGRGMLDGLPAPVASSLRESGLLPMLEKPFLQCLLAARQLDSLPDAEVAELFLAAPLKWSEAVGVLVRRRIHVGRAVASLLQHLVAAGKPSSTDSHLVGAILSAGLLAESSAGEAMPAVRDAIAAALLLIVEQGRLAVPQRAEAGRHLARLGDPRDLEALVPVAGGRFTMGSPLHPNSTPAHEVTVQNFAIGMYPVTNRLYRQFVEDTGRNWLSQDGRKPERANSPAVDLTWHDARACCDWLTERWRAAGKIAATQRVRLATEPEWEYAARGARAANPGDAVYAWQGAWAPDHSNSEEAGFNDTCPVGIFPKGRSPWGCYDMCGQIWEWTTTLWGDDMATPSWKYPYADDGREDIAAGPRIRRVLRGGCFSSNKDKACCTYRGSLEPAGFWRGNGFRVVVS